MDASDLDLQRELADHLRREPAGQRAAYQPDFDLRGLEAMAERERQGPRPRRWTKADTALQAALLGLTVADVLQTEDAFRRGEHERNPLLGKHPSRAKLWGLGVLGSNALTGAISYALPQPYRRGWQLGLLGLEGANVANNHRNGFQVNLGKSF